MFKSVIVFILKTYCVSSAIVITTAMVLTFTTIHAERMTAQSEIEVIYELNAIREYGKAAIRGSDEVDYLDYRQRIRMLEVSKYKDELQDAREEALKEE